MGFFSSALHTIDPVARQTRAAFGGAPLAGIPAVVYRFAPDLSAVEYASEGIREVSGYPPGDFVREGGRAWADIVHPEDRQAVRAALERSLHEGRPYALEYHIVAADGRVVPVWDRGRAVVAADGRARWLDGVIIDVTDSKRAQEEHARLEQLLQAQKSEAFQRLAGGFAHDLNNLMTVVVGFSQLLLHHLGEDDPIRAQIEEIGRAGARAADLAGRLLAFAGRQALSPRPLDVNEAVARLEGPLRRLVGERIELVTALEPDLPPVAADPDQLERVIVSLVANARDAMPMGGSVVVTTASAVIDETVVGAAAEPGAYVALSVGDTGIGMDEETRSRLFEPLFTTKTENEAGGLSLSTVHGIVSRSGGAIAVASKPGQGATFTLYLPPARLPEGRPVPRGS